jgi:regulator of replication initiation timing
MAKQAVAAHSVDLEPIDRLEEKINRLVSIVAQLRAEQAKSLDDNSRLAQEIDALRARLDEAGSVQTEVLALRDERDLIRARVAEMLQQLEAI